MNMESNTTGADRQKDLDRKLALKKAKFDEIHRLLDEANAPSLSYHEFLKKSWEIAEQNQKEKEERDPNKDSDPPLNNQPPID